MSNFPEFTDAVTPLSEQYLNGLVPSSSYLISGGIPTTATGLAVNQPATVAVINDGATGAFEKRVASQVINLGAGAVAQDNYVDLRSDGTYIVSTVAAGAAAPVAAANVLRLYKATTNAGNTAVVFPVTDLSVKAPVAQAIVAADLTEQATNDALTPSGTLLTSLNRIRYQMAQMVGGAWNAARAFVQLSPASQQAGSINVSGSVQAAALNIAAGASITGDTVLAGNLTLADAVATITASAASSVFVFNTGAGTFYLFKTNSALLASLGAGEGSSFAVYKAATSTYLLRGYKSADATTPAFTFDLAGGLTLTDTLTVAGQAIAVGQANGVAGLDANSRVAQYTEHGVRNKWAGALGGASPPAALDATWRDLTAGFSFTLPDAATVVVTITGQMYFSQTAAGLVEIGFNVDGTAGQAPLVDLYNMAGGSTWSVRTYTAVLSLAAGAHTVKLQATTNGQVPAATGSLVFNGGTGLSSWITVEEVGNP